MMEAMEFITDASPELDPVETEDSPGVFQTVRVETETLPPLVELGRKLLVKAQDGDAEGVKDLMQQGAPFTTDWLGTSAIHWACQLNHLEVADVLLKAGISRDARNKVDRTPLHVTAQEGHIQILKLLLNHGVDVDAVDMLRMTPLHWAAEYGHEECVRLLLEHGADPVAVNKFDKTPDQIAFDNNRLDITHIIQEYAENPLRHVRRKEAKEKQKMAAAAHKAVLELERVNKLMAAKQAASAEKGKIDTSKTIKESIQLMNGAQVRVVKIPKRKGRMVFESTLKPTGSLVLSPTQPLTVMEDNQPPTPPIPPPPPTLPLQQSPLSVVSNDTANTEKTLALLQAHGITMLPNDDSTIVASAVQSGQKIVLTEAGKMALNLTEKPSMKPVQLPVQMPMGVSPIKGLIKLPPELLRGKKLIKIRADQLINMKNEKRVIIQTDKRFQPAPVLNKPRLEIPVPQTNPVEVVVTKTTVNNRTQLTSSFVQREPGHIVNGLLPDELEVDVTETTQSGLELELERIRRELEERTNEVNMLREKLEQKEQEVEQYKRILELVRGDELH